MAPDSLPRETLDIFLDYEKVKPMLEIWADSAGEQFPTSGVEPGRHRHIVETFRGWQEVIKEEGKELKEIYDDVQTYVRVSISVVHGVEFACWPNVLSAGGLVPLMVMSLRATAKGAVAIGKSKAGKAAAAGSRP